MLNKSGFTLIETLIYSAIVVMVLTLTLAASYGIIESQDRITKLREIAENEHFLTQKIVWVLQNVDALNSPPPGSVGSTLSVDRLGYAFNPLEISLQDGVVVLKSGSTTTPLTNSYVSVSSLIFSHQILASTTAVRVTALLENDIAHTSVDTTILVK